MFRLLAVLSQIFNGALISMAAPLPLFTLVEKVVGAAPDIPAAPPAAAVPAGPDPAQHPIKSMCKYGNGNHVAVVRSIAAGGALDRSIYLYDLSTAIAGAPAPDTLVSRVQSSDQPTALLVFNDKRMVSGNIDGSIDVWNAPVAPVAPVAVAVAVAPVPEVILSGTPPNTTIPGVNDPARNDRINALTFLPWINNETRLVSGHQSGDIKIWPAFPLAADAVPALTLVNADPINALVVNTNGDIVSGDERGNINLWSVAVALRTGSGAPVAARTVVHGAPVKALTLLNTGSIISASENIIKMWSPDLQVERVIVNEALSGTTSMTVLPGTGRLVTANGNEIKLWPADISSGTRPVELGGHTTAVQALTVTGGGYLVSAGGTEIKRWAGSAMTAPVVAPVACADRTFRPGTFKTLVNIAGEQVQVEEKGFNPNQYHDRVSFAQEYFPGQTAANLKCAKNTFMMVFGGPTPITPENPVPPCSSEDRDTLLAGLRYRYTSLSNKISDIRDGGGVQDSVDLRTKIAQLEQLRMMIMGLEENVRNSICEGYDQAGETLGFGIDDTKLNDNMKELLRKFVYVLVQKGNPMSNVGNNYGLTDKDVADVIASVSKVNTDTQPAISTYLNKWSEEKKAPIPGVIGSVMGVTGKLDAINASLKRGVDGETRNKIVALFTRKQAGGGDNDADYNAEDNNGNADNNDNGENNDNDENNDNAQAGGALPDTILTEIKSITESSDEPSTQVQRIVELLSLRLDECSTRSSQQLAESHSNKMAIDKLEKQYLDVEQRLVGAMKEKDKCMEGISKKDAKIASCVGDKTTVETEIGLLRANYTEQLNIIQKTTADLLKQKQDLQAALAAFQEVMNNNNKGVAEANIERVASEEQLASIKNILANAVDQNAVITGTFHSLTNALGDTTAQVAALEAKPQGGGGTIQEQIVEIHTHLERLKNETVNAMVEKSDANMEAKTLEIAYTEKVEALQQQVDLLKTMLPNETALQARVDELNKKVLEMGSKISEKDRVIAEKTGEASKQALLDTSEQQKAEQVAASKDAELQLVKDELEQKKKELGDVHTSLEGQVTALKKQLAEAQAAAAKAQLAVTTATAVNTNDSNKLKEAQKTIATNNQEAARLKNLAELANNNLNAIENSMRAFAKTTSKGAGDTVKALGKAAETAKSNNNGSLSDQIQAIAENHKQLQAVSDKATTATGQELVSAMNEVSKKKEIADPVKTITTLTGGIPVPVAVSPPTPARKA